MAVSSHRDLIVWQKAVKLVTAIYHVTRSFPREERFGLTQQIRRAAVSIASNIAEGKGRASTGAYLSHLSIAAGSLCEVDTQLEIAKQLGFITTENVQQITEQLDEIGRMLTGLKKSLDGSLPKS